MARIPGGIATKIAKSADGDDVANNGAEGNLSRRNLSTAAHR